MRRVAVEDGLSNVSRALRDAGFQVTGTGPGDLQGVQAVVVSGGDSNIMQMEDIKTRVPVLNASGRTPEEIVKTLKERLL